MPRLYQFIVWTALWCKLCTAFLGHVRNIAHIKRAATEIEDSYDYIIIGGGTSGLTVADRLTEDPKKTVLVIDSFDFDNDPNVLIPGKVDAFFLNSIYNITSVPQPGLNGRTSIVFAGAVIGGGSAVNGMFFDRGAAADYDSWESLGNEGWGWKGIFPYFKKSVSFTPPPEEDVAKYGYTYDESAYGGNGPVQASFPRFQYPGTRIQLEAWKELGVPVPKEGAGGDAIGAIWAPNSLDPKNETRSYSRTAHYDRVIKKRPNYHLLTNHVVEKVTLSDGLVATGVVFKPGDGTSSSSVKAKLEVIVAAGSVHTPGVLQRSGIGPKALLDEAGIKVLLNLPGVGQNFQDHPTIGLSFNFTTDVTPNPGLLASDPAFQAAAWEEYVQNRTGPYTLCRGASAAFLPLKTISTKVDSIISAPGFTSIPQGTDPAIKAGLLAQRALLLSHLASSKSAIMEQPYGGSGFGYIAIMKPFSRGSININVTSPLSEPVVDYGVFTESIDETIAVEMFKYVRKYFATDALKVLSPVELSPGPSVQTDADILEFLKETGATPSSAHPCCTAGMLPLELGGVVGPDLKVHGTKKLSIIDASIFPLVPATHLSSTVYAVAEKAADLIKARV